MALFPPRLSYWFEKVHEAARGSHAREYGARHLSLIGEVVDKLKTALERRQIAGAGSGVEDQLRRLEYTLAQLDEYFTEKGQGRLNANDAEIFTSYLQQGVSNLKKMAQELDDEYAAELE